MSQEANASTFSPVTTLAGVSFLCRVANRFRNVAGELLEGIVRRVSHKTANYTVLASESGHYFTNAGATGTITFTLPAATVGLHFTFKVRAVQQLRVDPNGSETLENTASVEQAAGAYLWADAKGEFIHIICLESGKWAMHNSSGTWTAV
jgi:hypothetical protein